MWLTVKSIDKTRLQPKDIDSTQEEILIMEKVVFFVLFCFVLLKLVCYGCIGCFLNEVVCYSAENKQTKQQRNINNKTTITNKINQN